MRAAVSLAVVGVAALLAAKAHGQAPHEHVNDGRTYTAPKVAPEEFNGDVRSLPKTPPTPRTRERPEHEAPADHKPRPILRTPEPNLAFGPMPAPSRNFPGLSVTDYVYGSPSVETYPSDVNGEVGPNHYVEAINEAYAIYAKDGTLISSFTENALWSSSASDCNGHSGGDPVVVYDSIADRWLLTHLAYHLDNSGNPAPPFYECIAVSKTGDPVLGGWWLYTLLMDPGGAGFPPSDWFNDYPKFGVWTDCVYMTSNEFSEPSGARVGTAFASLSKSDLYSGAALTWALGYFGGSDVTFTMIPGNILGGRSSPPPPGTQDFFVSESINFFEWEVRKFTPGPNCAGGIGLSAFSPVPQTNYNVPAGTVAPQLGTTGLLDSLTDRMMQKVQYRKIGAAESLWVTHGTASAGNVLQPQWAQIDVTGGVVGSAVQQQIYAPDQTVHRWMSSLAVDSMGNMAIGYSTSNASMYPSIAYSGRLASDPPNTLPQSETQLQAGGGSQTLLCQNNIPCSRWGDYTSMSVDPVNDCTFWYVNQYYADATNGAHLKWQTRIGSFKFPGCVENPNTPDLSVTLSHQGALTPSRIGVPYSIEVSNVGLAPTTAAVSLVAAVPTGLAATSLAGAGWSCDLPSLTCTRGDTLYPGTAYAPITLTADVAAHPSASLASTATVSGGGETNTANDVATDSTPPLVKGDVNGDGKVDVADVFYLVNYLFAGGPPPQ